MTLDLSNLPTGGYGAILTKSNMWIRGLLDIDATIFGLSLDERGELTRETELSSAEFRDMVESSDACYKLLFSCDQGSCVKEDKVVEKLRRKLDETTLKTYTTFNPINGFYMFRMVFPGPMNIKTTLSSASLNAVYLFPQRWCESGLRVTDATAGQLTDAIFFLNDNGIFHNDIKDDNVMMCQGKATFIDFGSATVDDAPDADMRAYYKPKAIVYPVIQTFYGYGPRGATTLSRGLMIILEKTNTVKKMLDKFKNMPLFQRYLFHKNDCFMLAQLLYSKRQRGGGFMCFGKPKVLNDGADASDRTTRAAIAEAFPGLERLLFFDDQDFSDFRDRYKNCRSGPGQVAGRARSGDAKERMRYKGRSYVVRTGPRGGKYILRNNEKVYV